MTARRLALVVAVDRYDHAALQGLASPTADAEALAEVLGDADLGGFDVDVVRNEPSWIISQRVEVLLAERSADDLVLLHFSCHGLKDDSGELYLAATNTRPGLLGSTAVEAAWVNRVMQRSRAQRIVLLLDCCYGGAFERGVVARAGGDIDVGDQFRPGGLGQGRGRAIITASTAMEYAFEGPRLTGGHRPGPSLFTGALVEGIRTGEADRDQDGQVSLDELYNFVYDQVRQRSPNQTPSKWEFGLRGGLYIARNPHRRIMPARLPPDLVDLIEHPSAAARLAGVQELAALAAGTHLPRAVAARLALRQLIEDDSRRVSASAAAALQQSALRLTASNADFGRVPPSNWPLVTEVGVEGGPLALASAVTTSGGPLRAQLDAGTLRITWVPEAPGRLDGVVIVAGPAGEAQVRVTGEVAEQIPVPSPQVGPASVESAEQSPRETTDITKQPTTAGSGPPARARQSSSDKPPDKQRRHLFRATRIPASIGAGVGIIALLIIIITASSGSNPPPTGAATTPASPSAKPIIFQDDFSDRTSGWDDAGGRTAGGHYTNGAYRIYADPVPGGGSQSGVPRNASSMYPNAPQDIRIAVAVHGVTGRPETNAAGFGIFCRDRQNTGRYEFTLANGYTSIGKISTTGAWKTLSEKDIAIDLNTTNRLDAVCSSEGRQAVHLVFSVNGKKLAEATDAKNPYLTGTIGLFAGTDETATAAIEAEFDNFVVTSER